MAAEIRNVSGPESVDPTHWERIGAAAAAVAGGVWFATKRLLGRKAKSDAEEAVNAEVREPEWARHLIEALRENTHAVREMRDAVHAMEHKLERVHSETSASIGNAFANVLMKVAEIERDVAVRLAELKR